MKQQGRRKLCLAIGMLGGFWIWTALVSLVDVQAIGPLGSEVGFAAVNRFVHELAGENLFLYTLTDWLGFVPLGFACGFALLGLAQWLKRKSLLKVDRSILALGVFYVVVMAVFLLFEVMVINYRPVLIDGVLEASYPSSTTVLVLCVMPTAVMQLNRRIKHAAFRRFAAIGMIIFTALMVVGRLASGVHWFTDIVGGMLLSGGLVALYGAFAD